MLSKFSLICSLEKHIFYTIEISQAMKMCTPGLRNRMGGDFNKVSYRTSLSPDGFLGKGKVSDAEGLPPRFD